MAEINKLSVGQVLDKLRSTDVPKSKITRLDEKTEGGRCCSRVQVAMRLRSNHHRS